jgi:cytochrome P450
MTDATTDTICVPARRADPFDPPREYGQLRSEQGVSQVLLASGARAWLITRHALVREVLQDARFSSDRFHPSFPMMVRQPKKLVGAMSRTRSLPGMDGPEHAAARRAVIGEFTFKRMQLLRPRVQEIIEGRVDAMLASGPPADLVAAYSMPIPSMVICEMLGVPYADHDFFQEQTIRLLSQGSTPEQTAAAMREFRGYIDRLVTAKEEDPGDDLIGRQIRERQGTEAGTHEALVNLAFLLLIAGHETTANMISLGCLALMREQEQLALMQQDPAKVPLAVEEMLRYFSIAELVMARVALEDVEIGGVLIRAGDGVLACASAADRDPDAFPDPDTIDIGRAARHHVAFGYGPHQCVGQNLARMELEIAYETLFRRIPGVRPAAAFEDLPFKDGAVIYGLYELPVTW